MGGSAGVKRNAADGATLSMHATAGAKRVKRGSGAAHARGHTRTDAAAAAEDGAAGSQFCEETEEATGAAMQSQEVRDEMAPFNVIAMEGGMEEEQGLASNEY